ncbi:MAG: amino acid ABC transporter permease [Acetobacteraceae bacterium]|nr:amino acid ABC transporter permease [Acetobacteraceae bacterium]
MTYAVDFTPVFAAFGDLLRGLWLSVRLAALSTLIGGTAAIGLAAAKLSGRRLLRAPVDAYVELIRNTPLLVQVFFVFFGLPAIGLRLHPDTAALVALTLNAAAYMTEIMRAGIQSVARGQVEAGLALGLHRVQVFRHVVLIPALRSVYPALTSQFNVLLLGTSVVSAISADELTHVGEYIVSLTYRSFEVYLTIGVMYFVASWGFALLFGAAERRFFAYPA